MIVNWYVYRCKIKISHLKIDKSLKIENVTTRKIERFYKQIQTMQFSSMVGSNVLVSEGRSLVQRSFWP